MRKVLILILVALPIAEKATAQQESVPAGFACFENLAPPEYPASALESFVGGTVWTTVQVSPQANAEKIDTQVVSAWSSAPKLLVPPVEKVIRSAKIKPECAGKTVSLVFRYQVFGDPMPAPKATSRIESPNIMWIESQPPARSGP